MVILQRHPRPDEILYIKETLGHERVFDASDVNEDLIGATAMLSLLDEYVTVSNTLLHLYVGLGKRAHVLVPHSYEWRWAMPGKSPWFPLCINYKQTINLGWGDVFSLLARDLNEKINAR